MRQHDDSMHLCHFWGNHQGTVALRSPTAKFWHWIFKGTSSGNHFSDWKGAFSWHLFFLQSMPGLLLPAASP